MAEIQWQFARKERKMGLMKPVQKKQKGHKGQIGKGELNFSEEALVFRLGCGGPFMLEEVHGGEHEEEYARLNMRREEEGVFLESDEFADGNSFFCQPQEISEVELLHHKYERIEKLEHRKALEKLADQLLRENPTVSTDATPGPVADADYRQHEKETPKLRHRLSQYVSFEVVYDTKQQVKHPSYRRIVGMKQIMV